jgi:hypothetical protein
VLSNTFQDQWRWLRRFIRHADGFKQHRAYAFRYVGFGKEAEQRLAGFDLVAEASEHFEAGGMIELVAEPLAAPAQRDNGLAEFFGVD